jgi:hypothetical protein
MFLVYDVNCYVRVMFRHATAECSNMANECYTEFCNKIFGNCGILFLAPGLMDTIGKGKHVHHLCLKKIMCLDI